MSEMIERVARAICEAEGISPDMVLPGHSKPVWQLAALTKARAAISAMLAESGSPVVNANKAKG